MPRGLFPRDATPSVRERMAAGAWAVMLHGLLAWWLLAAAGIGVQGAGDAMQGSGEGLVVEFIVVPAPATHPQRASIAASTTMPHARSETGEYLRQAATTSPADQPPSAPTSASRDASGGSSADDLLASYQAALRVRIAQTWRTLTGKKFPAGCTLRLSQSPGGAVTATSADDCDLSSEDRLQLEAAALLAQPLPYVGYEAVFAPEMELRF